MALLTLDKRKKYFLKLGYGEYNTASIKKMQKKYLRSVDVDGIYGKNTDILLRHLINCSTVKDFEPEEFKCTCGHCTGYPTWMRQVELKHLQKIRDHFKVPMDITSGVRCAYENNRVGGVPNSGHLTGYAADFYAKGVTDTVANRTASMAWIVKQSNHKFTYGAYMKDSDGLYRTAASMGNAMHTETKKASANYFKVIDVSDWQDKIDWKKVKADGVVGAVIRYADGTTLDKRFAENMKNAKVAGLHIGSYIFSRAKTKAEAESEATRLYNACKAYALDMPMFIDLEVRGYEKYADTVAIAFLAKMKALGGRGGVYASLNWWNNYLKVTATEHANNPFWIAQYNSTMDYKPKSRMGMWQYTSSGSVNGIKGNVDMNECYIEYWKVKTKTNAEKLADCAKSFAYSTNTSEANYKTGKPKKEYIEALDKYYPGQRQHWSHGGASCDSFQGTCVRASGLGADCPRGLSISYLVKSPNFKEVFPKSVADLKDGDIIIRFNEKTQKGHTCIFCDGKIKEASNKDFWPKTTDTAKSRLSADGARVFRAK